MAMLTCKMCGGTLIVEPGTTVAECDSCGLQQTIPSADNEKKVALFNQADELRRNKYFDRAAAAYERIVVDFPEEAEAYWGLVLCEYGIEYVKDPASGLNIPTCHRFSYDSVLADPNYQKTIRCADVVARKQYEQDANQLEDIRKGIVEVTSKKEPYDIFICYKETDEETKERTRDSVEAYDVCEALTDKGYRVFFSRVTMEQYKGEAYEPIIFAALNSAKVMLVFGSRSEYVNAPWVRNEWSRYLKIMAKDKSRQMIPCYWGDPYLVLPSELQHIQGHSMNPIGARQELIRSVERLLPRQKPQVQQQVIQQVVQGGPNVAALLKRGNNALEDGAIDAANEFFNKVLSEIDPDNAEAYLGLALVEMRVKSLSAMVDKYTTRQSKLPKVQKVVAGRPDRDAETEAVKCYRLNHYLSADDIKKYYKGFNFDYSSELVGWKELKQEATNAYSSNNLRRAAENADPNLRSRIQQSIKDIDAYYDRKIAEARAKDEQQVKDIDAKYKQFLKNADNQVRALRVKAEQTREADYQAAVNAFNKAVVYQNFAEVKRLFQQDKIREYKDSDQYLQKCDAQMEVIILREAKEHDGKILRKTWTKAIIFGILMVLYTLIALPLGLGNAMTDTVLPALISSGAFIVIALILALIPGIILTHKIMKRWDPMSCITTIIKLVIWFYLCVFLTMIFCFVLTLAVPILALLLIVYMSVVLGIISIISQVKGSRDMYKKSNKGKVWPPVLATIGVVVLMALIGTLIVGGANIVSIIVAYASSISF